MITVNINNKDINYEIINDNEAFNYDEFVNYYTSYFEKFDYIVGDIAYAKLRLKGFYDGHNKNVGDHNNIDNLDKYLETYCAYKCKYFVLKKLKM